MPLSVMSIILSGMVFAVLHSLLASDPVKNKCYSKGISPRAYRLAYTVIAVAATTVWLSYVRRLPDQHLYVTEGLSRWLLYMMQLSGLLIFWLSLKPVEIAAFLGLTGFTGDEAPFIEQGIYRIVRHPMYCSIIIIMYAMPDQTVNSLTLYTVITCYFIVGARFEERRMSRIHPEYAGYRNRVPAFVPRLKIPA